MFAGPAASDADDLTDEDETDSEELETADVEDDIEEDDEEAFADQFDEIGGPGAWPGQSADDAEPDDFEDSVGDLEETGYGDDE